MLITKTPRNLFVSGLAICALAIVSISALHACNTVATKTAAPVAPVATLGRSFEVAIGKSVTISNQKLGISFVRVVDDSRCPAGVDCVWSGQATVVVKLEKAGRKAQTATLTVQGSRYVSEKSIAKVGDYWIKLNEVSPEKGPPETPGTIQKINLTVQNRAFAASKNGR